MQLYYLPGSPFARVARIIVHERAIPCELVEDNGYPLEKAPAVNPAMQVPALVVGERKLFGTRLIADYLMDLPAAADAAPSGSVPPFAAQPTREANHWRDSQVLVALESLVSALVLRSYLLWTGVEHRENAALGLDLADREMTRSARLLDWLEGEATPEGFIPGVFSLQDAWLVSTIAWTEARIAIPWRGRPNLEAILKATAARPSIAATLPSPSTLPTDPAALRG